MNVNSFSKKLYIILLSLILFFGSFVGFSSLRTVKADTQTEYVIEAGEYEFKTDITFPATLLTLSGDFLLAGVPFDNFTIDINYSFISVMNSSSGPPYIPTTVYNNGQWTADNYRFITFSVDTLVSSDFYDWFMANLVQSEPEPEPEQNKGALNMAYEFFYTWLWGESPNETFAPYADSITLFIALFFVVLMAYFAFRLVTGLIKLIYYLFDVRK